MTELAEHLHSDTCAGKDFDKTARVASHSAGGVIELMPVADNAYYSFKYVNGHLAAHRRAAHGDGVWCAVQWLPATRCRCPS